VGHRRRHLTERGEPIAQPFALLDLLDPRQVLEEERGAGDGPGLVVDQRQRVADHGAGRLEAEFDAVGQVVQLEGAGQHPDDVLVRAQHVGVGASEVRRIRRQREDAVRLGIHHGDGAVAGHGQHAVAHAGDHLPEEAIVEVAAGCLCVEACRPVHRRATVRGSDVWGRRQERHGLRLADGPEDAWLCVLHGHGGCGGNPRTLVGSYRSHRLSC
jgi:hypothetical protein